MTDFARWVRENRQARGLTQQALAEEAGLSDKTIFRAERGEPVSAYTQAQLAACLGSPSAGQSRQTGHFVVSIYREHLG